jgi:hypothetical protein
MTLVGGEAVYWTISVRVKYLPIWSRAAVLPYVAWAIGSGKFSIRDVVVRLHGTEVTLKGQGGQIGIVGLAVGLQDNLSGPVGFFSEVAYEGESNFKSSNCAPCGYLPNEESYFREERQYRSLFKLHAGLILKLYQK